MSERYPVHARAKHFRMRSPYALSGHAQCRSCFPYQSDCAYAAWPTNLFVPLQKTLPLHVSLFSEGRGFQWRISQSTWQSLTVRKYTQHDDHAAMSVSIPAQASGRVAHTHTPQRKDQCLHMYRLRLTVCRIRYGLLRAQSVRDDVSFLHTR